MKRWKHLLALSLALTPACAGLGAGASADAHSCYRSSAPLLSAPAEAPLRAEASWLLLADPSQWMAGASSYDAWIVEGGSTRRARWRSIAPDSVRVDWTGGGAGSTDLNVHLSGVSGLARAAGARWPVRAERVDCSVAPSLDATA